MDDDKPKITAWNYDSQNISNAPELKRQQTASWSSVAENMTNDVQERHTIKWYFNVPMIITILAVSFFSHLIGAILVILFMSRIIISVIRSNRSPSKVGSVIGWLVLTILFLGISLII